MVCIKPFMVVTSCRNSSNSGKLLTCNDEGNPEPSQIWKVQRLLVGLKWARNGEGPEKDLDIV